MRIPDSVYGEVFRQRAAELDMTQDDVTGAGGACDQSAVNKLFGGKRKFTPLTIKSMRVALRLEEDKDFDQRVENELLRYYRHIAMFEGHGAKMVSDLDCVQRYAELRLIIEKKVEGMDAIERRKVEDWMEVAEEQGFRGLTIVSLPPYLSLLGDILTTCGEPVEARWAYRVARNAYFGLLLNAQMRLTESYFQHEGDPQDAQVESDRAIFEQERQNCEKVASLFDVEKDHFADFNLQLAEWHQETKPDVNRFHRVRAATTAWSLYLQEIAELTANIDLTVEHGDVPEGTCNRLSHCFLGAAKANVLLARSTKAHIKWTVQALWAAVYWQERIPKERLILQQLLQKTTTIFDRLELPMSSNVVRYAMASVNEAAKISPEFKPTSALDNRAALWDSINYGNLSSNIAVLQEFALPREDIHLLRHVCLVEVISRDADLTRTRLSQMIANHPTPLWPEAWDQDWKLFLSGKEL